MNISKESLTPALKQYLEIKSQYPDALLFFRMGDFYELFFEDAQIASRELQITLTSRNPNSENPVPMCGVPHHAVREYLKVLLEKRYKVAICEQVEDPKKAKGIVKRAVTKVLTPGTVVEEIGLVDKRNNFLASALFDRSKDISALCWIDFSTGDWMGFFNKEPQRIWEWLLKIEPNEILLAEGEEIPKNCTSLKDRVTWVSYDFYFNYSKAIRELCEAQGVPNLEPLDLKNKPQLVQCCGALITYLKKTQNTVFSHLKPFKVLNLSKYLILDDITERNLEIFRRLDGSKGRGTLLHVLDFTMTPMGGRKLELRLKQPFRELEYILKTQDVVDFLYNKSELRDKLRTYLDRVYDLERVINRIFLGRAVPKDFVSLRESIAHLPNIQSALNSEEQSLPKAVIQVLKKWDNLEDIYELLNNSLVENPPQVVTEGGLFKKGYVKELDELIELTSHGEGKIKELLEEEQRKNNFPRLKLGYNKVFGYFFEVPKSFKGKIPQHFHRRQTLSNVERYTTDELKRLEEKIFTATEKRKELEYELFLDLRKKVSKYRDRIIKMSDIIADLDVWQSLSEAAFRWRWTKPEVHRGDEISIIEGRHPVIEAYIGRQNYIPNNVHLDKESKILIITGPNMAGKSTILRQTAIICILAQMGSFVPAKHCKIGLCDKIFTRVGASDNLIEGQSTFMQEMVETARILRQSTKKSLVILDEIGRGTSTFDGMAIAWAVVESLSRKEGGIRTLFATHYHELTVLEKKFQNIKNFNVAVKEWKGDIIFLRKMLPGPSDKSYGIEVAKLAGVPVSVIKRAKEILQYLEEKSRYLKVGKDQDTFSLLPRSLFRRNKEKEEKMDLDHPVIKEIKDIDINNLTPIKAFQFIVSWKERLK